MSLLTIPELAVVRRMLRANIRHTEIARRLGLPVETVTRVATSRRLRRRKLHLLTEEDLPEGDAPPDYLAANLRRCEGCGGMVYHWPCLACRIRDAQSAGIVLPDEEDCIAATSDRGEPDEEGDDCAPTGQPATVQCSLSEPNRLQIENCEMQIANLQCSIRNLQFAQR